jgi:hypothetical protein
LFTHTQLPTPTATPMLSRRRPRTESSNTQPTRQPAVPRPGSGPRPLRPQPSWRPARMPARAPLSRSVVDVRGGHQSTLAHAESEQVEGEEEAARDQAAPARRRDLIDLHVALGRAPVNQDHVGAAVRAAAVRAASVRRAPGTVRSHWRAGHRWWR